MFLDKINQKNDILMSVHFFVVFHEFHNFEMGILHHDFLNKYLPVFLLFFYFEMGILLHDFLNKLVSFFLSLISLFFEM